MISSCEILVNIWNIFVIQKQTVPHELMLVAQLWPTLCSQMNCGPLGSSVRGILQQESWSGLPFPSPGDLPNQRLKLMSPALAGIFFTTAPPGKTSELFTSKESLKQFYIPSARSKWIIAQSQGSLLNSSFWSTLYFCWVIPLWIKGVRYSGTGRQSDWEVGACQCGIVCGWMIIDLDQGVVDSHPSHRLSATARH